MNPDRPAFSSSLIRPEQSVLVIIDVQERLTPVIAGKEALIENVIRLVKFSRIMNLPLILTEQEKLGRTLPGIRQERPDAPVISKVHFNCFGSEAFRKEVEGHKRKVLILAGIEAHICVLQTAIHAVSEYTVHAVNDAVSSRAPGNRDTALRRMEQAGATITSTETVIYELLERAGTPAFKKALQLVK